MRIFLVVYDPEAKLKILYLRRRHEMSKNITRILCMILTLAMVAAFALVPMASAAAATKTIYFDNSGQKWSQVYAYTWGGSASSNWPGTQMTAVDFRPSWSVIVYGIICSPAASTTRTAPLPVTVHWEVVVR